MPTVKLTKSQRRAVQLAVLSGIPGPRVAREHGIGTQRVYDLRDEAIREAEEELDHWLRVRELIQG